MMLNPDHAIQRQMEDLNDQLTTHVADTRDALNLLDDATDCIRFGLMEFGGFFRRHVLSAADRSHMFIQECANFVIWNVNRNRPDNTDQPPHDGEEAETENLTEDEEERGPTVGIDRLVNAMRIDQNTALARELWDDGAQIQTAIIWLLDASAGPNPIGLTTEVINQVRNVFHRLWRRARNRNHRDRADAYRRYIDDMHGVMNG